MAQQPERRAGHPGRHGGGREEWEATGLPSLRGSRLLTAAAVAAAFLICEEKEAVGAEGQVMDEAMLAHFLLALWDSMGQAKATRAGSLQFPG